MTVVKRPSYLRDCAAVGARVQLVPLVANAVRSTAEVISVFRMVSGHRPRAVQSLSCLSMLATDTVSSTVGVASHGAGHCHELVLVHCHGQCSLSPLVHRGWSKTVVQISSGGHTQNLSTSETERHG